MERSVDRIARRVPTMIVGQADDGSLIFEIPPLSWEDRAIIAEEKLQSLVDGLESEETFLRMVDWNPIAAAIVRMALSIHSRQENDE